jgi:hypothetical protein
MSDLPATPPTRADVIALQRNNLMQRVLDMEADTAMLQIELNGARARIAELEAQVEEKAKHHGPNGSSPGPQLDAEQPRKK